MKKALLIILAAIMCIAILPISVSAESTSKYEAYEATESYSSEEIYEDFMNRLTHFKLETVSDFIFWSVIAVTVIIILVILVIAVGIVLEVIIVPILTLLAGPVGTVGGLIAGLLGAVVASIEAFVKWILPLILDNLPEIIEALLVIFENT